MFASLLVFVLIPCDCIFSFYSSPEIHLQQPYAHSLLTFILFRRYSTQTDIYSLGVVFLELLTLKQTNPFLSYSSALLDSSELTYEDHLESCLAQIPPQYCQATRDILREMLDRV